MKKVPLSYGSGDVPTRYIVPVSATADLPEESVPQSQHISTEQTA